MDLIKLRKFAEDERSKPTREAYELLCQIVTWFQGLPDYFDSEQLKEETLKAIENEEDTFTCELLKDGTAKIELDNSNVINKTINLSEEKIAWFDKLNSCIYGRVSSIVQNLFANSPIQIFFYFEDEESFLKFQQRVEQILPGIIFEFDYDTNIATSNDHMVVMVIYEEDLANFLPNIQV